MGDNAKSYVAASALALGAIGRADARSPLIQALKATDNEMNRASWRVSSPGPR